MTRAWWKNWICSRRVVASALNARLDITQQELADKVGLQQKTVALIERGKQQGLSAATLVALAQALGDLSLDYLMSGAPKRQPREGA